MSSKIKLSWKTVELKAVKIILQGFQKYIFYDIVIR